MNNPTHKKTDSVVDLVRNLLPDDQEFAQDLEQQIDRRRIIAQLGIIRNQNGFSQADVAEQLGCTQGRISKLENGWDEDLSLADLAAYAKLAHCDLNIVFSSQERNPEETLQYHAGCIQTCFDRLTSLLPGDQVVAQGVAKFHLEALTNLLQMLAISSRHSASKLPCSSAPQINLHSQPGPIVGSENCVIPTANPVGQ